jgi:hypothetical protein
MCALPADFVVADSQKMFRFPGGAYDLIHVDGQKDGDGTFHDLKLALAQARYILLDGYFWSSDNLQAAASFIEKFRDLIEYAAVVPGYAGELLLSIKESAQAEVTRATASNELRDTYDSHYFLSDCGGFESYKRSCGKSLEDSRLRAVASIAKLARPSRVLAGSSFCGRRSARHGGGLFRERHRVGRTLFRGRA